MAITKATRWRLEKLTFFYCTLVGLKNKTAFMTAIRFPYYYLRQGLQKSFGENREKYSYTSNAYPLCPVSKKL